MAVAALLVLVLVLLPALALVAGIAGGIAWLVNRPMTDEPPARSRTRRISATAAAAAAATGLALLLPGLVVGLRASPLLGPAALLAALPYVGLVLLGERLRGRRRSTRRVARLDATRPALPAAQRHLLRVMVGAVVVLAAVALLLEPLAPALAVFVPAAVLGCVCLLSVRATLAAPPDEALDPEVAAGARERATFRMSRTATAAVVVALGATLPAQGSTVALASGLVVAAAGAVLALLRPPRLALRPDVATDAHPSPTDP